MSTKTFPALLALAVLAAVDDPQYSAFAQKGQYYLSGVRQPGIRLRFKARGGVAADALAFRAPNVERAVDDQERELETHLSFEWADGPGYEVVDHDAVGVPEDGLVTVLFLSSPGDDVKSVSLEGTLEVLAGGKDVDLSFDKFESKKAGKLKSTPLKNAGLKVEVRTEERPGLLMTVTSSQQDIDDLTLVDKNGEFAHGVDWSGFSSGKEGRVVLMTDEPTLPKGWGLEIKVDAGGGAEQLTLLVTDFRADKKGKELTDDALEAAGIQVIAKTMKRPVLRASVDGEVPLLHDFGLESGGNRLRPSELDLIEFDGVDEFVWIYDEPWPKDTVLVGTVRVGGAWTEVPLVLSDIAVD